MRTYHPAVWEDVPASHPHSVDTHYRVSIGLEDWEDGPQPVEKVQMVYAGRVSGRRPPSYPAESDDHERVVAALKRLRARSPTPKKNIGFSESDRSYDTLTGLVGSANGIYGRTPEEIEQYLKELDDDWTQ